MIAQALPKTNELMNEINFYCAKGRRPTNWQIKLLTKKANDLKGKVEDYVYYDLLGRVAYLNNDSDQVHHYYEMALKQTATDYQTQLSYLIALNNIGRCSQAFRYGKTLLDSFSDNQEFLVFLIEFAMFSGRFQEASELLGRLEKPYNHPYYQTINDGAAIFQETQLTDDDVEHLQQLAFSIIPTMNLFLSDIEVTAVRNCIHFVAYVDLPIEEIFNVNWELAGVLAENAPDTYSDVLMFEYSSIDVLEEKRQS
ncbi:MAG: hypothetical protein PHU14_04505 [Methylovulum sp.]|nr:hypothetical protein [Methylovulum sp.]